MFQQVPYHLVGDEAFALQSLLLCPYPIQGIPEEQAIFNYRVEFYQHVGGSS